MTSFTPIASTVGGLLIGVAALGLLAFHGRIAGIRCGTIRRAISEQTRSPV